MVFLFKKWLAKSIILCLLVSLLLPNLAFARTATVIEELTDSSTTITNVAKRNSYTNDFLDVCYFPYDKKFYVVGRDGFLLSSYNDTTWSRNAETAINQSTNIDFIDIDCTDNYIVILGVGKTDGKSYAFVKKQISAFTKTDLNATLNIPDNLKASSVAVYENAGDATIVIVEENTGNHIYSKDSGQSWGRNSINGYATGSTAVTVDRSTGVFYTYNNNSTQTQYEFYASYTSVNNSWTHATDTTNKFTTVSNVYKNSQQYVALMHDDTSAHIYNILVQGGNKFKRAMGYVAEAAYLDTTSNVSIYVGWKDDFMVIRSSLDPKYNSYDYYPLEKIDEYEANSIVGKGKLYGVAAGKNASNQWLYVAVGSRGTLLKSTDGYNWSNEAQTLDSYNAIQHVAISEKPDSTTNEIMAAVVSNNVLYSTDLGTTWRPVNRIAIKGEVKDLRFIGDKLYVTENIISTGQVKIHIVTNAKEVSTTTLEDFIVNGVAVNQFGPVFYGKRKTANVAKIAAYDWRNSIVTRTYDETSNASGTTPAVDNLTLYAKMGTKEFFINGTGVHHTEYNPSSSQSISNTYSVDGSNVTSLGSKPYHFYTQLGNHYVFMSSSGEVRVSKDAATNTNYFSDTPYFTGKVIDAGYGLINMVQVNGLLVSLAWAGDINTSYNGIEWTHHANLSSEDTVSIGHNSNTILLGQYYNKIVRMNVPYNALTEEKVTPYPQAVYVEPGDNPINIATPEVYASINTNVDPNASSLAVSYQWYIENEDEELVALDGATNYRYDLADLEAGTYKLYVEVTYSDETKVDQPESSRLYGPYSYDLVKNVHDVDVVYSALSFEVDAGYTEVAPITATITNTGNQPITDLIITTTGEVLTAVPRSTGTLNVNESVIVDISLIPGIQTGNYSPTVTVQSAGNFEISQQISVNVLAAPVHDFEAALSPASVLLDYNYDPADAIATLSIENKGNRDLTDLNITMDSSGSAYFQVSSTSASIGVGQTETIEITPIDPLQPGSIYNYVVTVASQGKSVDVSGSFIVEEAPLYELTLTPIKNNVSVIDSYTDATVGQLEFKISNTGNRDISDLSVSLEGDAAASFTLGTYPASIAAGESVSVVLTPAPSLIIGEYNVTARVASDEHSINLTQALTLNVTNLPVYSQSIAITGALLDGNHMTLDHGYSSLDGKLTLTIMNTGNQELVPEVSTLPLNVIEVGSVPSIIAPGQSATVDLQVKPNLRAEHGTYSVYVSVSSEAGTSNELLEIVVKPAPVYSVSVAADRAEAAVVEDYTDANDGKFELTITNNGNQDLTGLSLSLSVQDQFTSSVNSTFDLNVNGNKTVVIKPISGLSAGTYLVTVTVSGNQINETITLRLVVNSITPSPSPSPSPSITPSPTDSITPSPTDSTTPSPTDSITPSPTDGSTPSPTDSITPNPSPSSTPSPTDGSTPSPTDSITPSPTDSITPSPSPSITPSPSPSSTPSPSPSSTPSPSPSSEPSSVPSPSPSAAPSGLPLSSAQVTVTQSSTATAQETISAIEQRGLTVIGGSIVNVSIDNASSNDSSNGSTKNREVYVPIELPVTESFTAAVYIDENGKYHPVPVVRDPISNTVTIYGTASGTYMLVNNENTLSDVDNHWASAAIQNLSNRLIVQGNANGEYKPEDSISRSEVAAIVVRALGLTRGEAQTSFSDLPEDRWDSEVVGIASAFGLITGYTDGNFHPTASITREDAMVIIARVANMLNLSATVDESTLARFTDSDQISGYAKNSVALAVRLGIVNGNPNQTLAPKDELSRAEFAVLIERLLGLAGLID